MTRSRLAHVSFSEAARKTMSGKGREGNKEGKGSRVVTFHHIVQLGDVAGSSDSVVEQ